MLAPIIQHNAGLMGLAFSRNTAINMIGINTTIANTITYAAADD